MATKVQIYLKRKEDAEMAIKAGADFIGLVSDAKQLLESSLGYAEAREVFTAVPRGKMTVALTVETNIAAIVEMACAVSPDVVHIAGTLLPLEMLAELRAAMPTIKLMQAVPMNDPGPIEMALKYQYLCDYFLLDTNDPDRIDIGATGQIHDWNKSAQLVREVAIPVILAGGLSPQNVAEAVRLVRPFGVDSFSHTNVVGSHDRKDPEKVRRFIKQAKTADGQ